MCKAMKRNAFILLILPAVFLLPSCSPKNVFRSIITGDKNLLSETTVPAPEIIDTDVTEFEYDFDKPTRKIAIENVFASDNFKSVGFVDIEYGGDSSELYSLHQYFDDSGNISDPAKKLLCVIAKIHTFDAYKTIDDMHYIGEHIIETEDGSIINANFVKIHETDTVKRVDYKKEFYFYYNPDNDDVTVTLGFIIDKDDLNLALYLLIGDSFEANDNNEYEIKRHRIRLNYVEN